MLPGTKVSIVLNTEDLKKVLDALDLANAILKPYLIAQSPSHRQGLPRMNDDTVPFVQKTLRYAETYTGFVPAYINVKELRSDFNIVEALAQVLKPIEQLYQSINDTMALSGSEAYVASLDFYRCLKQSAKAKVPGAKGIADDLKAHFAEGVHRYLSNYKVCELIRGWKSASIGRN